MNMKSLYYQFINFIQQMPDMWYTAMLLALFVVSILSVMKFFKAHNGTQNNFEKLGSLFLGVVVLLFLIFLVYIRK